MTRFQVMELVGWKELAEREEQRKNILANRV